MVFRQVIMSSVPYDITRSLYTKHIVFYNFAAPTQPDLAYSWDGIIWPSQGLLPNITVPRCGFSISATALQLTGAPGTCCGSQVTRDLGGVLHFAQVCCVCAEEPSEEGRAALHGSTVTAVLKLWLEEHCVEDVHMLRMLKQAASAEAWSTKKSGH